MSRVHLKSLIKYFGFFMVFVYLGVGIALLIPGVQIAFLNHSTRLVLGIALVFYGLFRAWRMIKTIQNEASD
jgi:hypothetical protein